MEKSNLKINKSNYKNCWAVTLLSPPSSCLSVTKLFISGKVSAVKEENGKREAAEVDPPAETCWQRTRKIIER